MRKDVPNIPYVAEAQENDFTQVCIQMAQWFCSWKLEKFTLGQTRRLSLTRSLNASRLLYHLTIFDAYIYMYISKTVCKENNKNLWKALARSWTSSEKIFSINILYISIHISSRSAKFKNYYYSADVVIYANMSGCSSKLIENRWQQPFHEQEGSRSISHPGLLLWHGIGPSRFRCLARILVASTFNRHVCRPVLAR